MFSGSAFSEAPFSDSQSSQSAGTPTAHVLVAESGSYTLSGQDATFIHSSGATSHTLTGESGSYTLTGQDATFIHTVGTQNHVLVGESGSYVLTGQEATFLINGQVVGNKREIEVVTGSGFNDLLKQPNKEEPTKRKKKKKRRARKRFKEQVSPIYSDGFIAELLNQNSMMDTPLYRDMLAGVTPTYVPQSDRLPMPVRDDSEVIEMLMLIHEM